jgi:hypothetical protein
VVINSSSADNIISFSLKNRVVRADDVSGDLLEIRGKRVAVFGICPKGLKVASLLCLHNIAISVFDMLPQTDKGASFQVTTDLKVLFDNYGVTLYTSHNLVVITDNEVIFEDILSKEIIRTKVDFIVLAKETRDVMLMDKEGLVRRDEFRLFNPRKFTQISTGLSE